MNRRAQIGFALLAVAGLAFLTGRFVVRPSVVFGESMAPTLRPWDLCLLRLCRHYEPRRGDIVMFRTADTPVLLFVKRVIALPGETIGISNGTVTINGVVLPEPSLTPNPEWSLGPTHVPDGKVYVIGDNRDVPMDLTVQGLVALRLVQARVVWHGRWRR